MKIIYLHQYFNTPEMSGGTRSFEMARRLVANGHEVDMITTDRSGETRGGWYQTSEAGVRVHWYPVPYSNKAGFKERLRAFLTFAWVGARKAASIDGDVVFATSTPLTIALPGIYSSRRLDIPFVFEVRDLWPELPVAIGALRNQVAIQFARWLEDFAYHSADRVVALSPQMKDGVVRQGVEENNVHVIPNSSDLDLFDNHKDGASFRRSYDWLQDRPLVVYTGTLGQINGVSYLARLASHVRKIDPEIRFLIVGTGIEDQVVRTEAHELGVLNRNLFMLPPIEKRSVPEVLGAATIATSLFIDLKEMWSNSANKFFDALAAGKPIAINYGGWQADLLRDHDAGIVLPPKDMNLAAKQLAAKVRDVDWLVQASQNSQRLAREQFDRDKLAKQFEDVLQAAVNARI